MARLRRAPHLGGGRREAHFAGGQATWGVLASPRALRPFRLQRQDDSALPIQERGGNASARLGRRTVEEVRRGELKLPRFESLDTGPETQLREGFAPKLPGSRAASAVPKISLKEDGMEGRHLACALACGTLLVGGSGC